MQYIKQLFEYDKWASQALLFKFERQFPQNERIYELFSHTLSTKRIWLDRCLGLPQSVERFQDRLPDEMKNDLESYHLAWIDFIDQLSTDALENTVRYANSKGDEFDSKLIDIFTHLINHGTHHRGAIIVLMKEEGFVPPNLDYISYVRLGQAR
jgi:uncharacterized damage-inducible protein DinB